MKKLFAFLLAALAALSLTVTAFAEEGEASVALSVTGADGLELDGSALLRPGEEYRFPLMIAENGGQARPMTVEDMENYDIKVAAKSGGNIMAEAGRLESGRQQYLSLTPGNYFGVSSQQVQYTVSLVKKGGSSVLSQCSVSWKVGYPAMDDDKLGASTQIDPSAPVLTREQLAAIQKITGAGQASFVGDGWQFSVRLLDQSAVNFHSSAANIQAISNKYPDADFRFMSFGGKPAFDFSGRLTLDVSEMLDEYGDIYLYRYLDGVLYSLGYQLDEENGTISIGTKQLGSYAVSNLKIPNGTVVGGAVPGSSSSGSNSGSSSDADKGNPSTGGADFTGIALAVGFASLAGAAAAVKVRKK